MRGQVVTLITCTIAGNMTKLASLTRPASLSRAEGSAPAYDTCSRQRTVWLNHSHWVWYMSRCLYFCKVPMHSHATGRRVSQRQNILFSPPISPPGTAIEQCESQSEYEGL